MTPDVLRNFTAIRGSVSEVGYNPRCESRWLVGVQANGCNFQAQRRPLGKTGLECSM